MISNKEWEAREDARILALAEKIRANPHKLKAAKGKARDGSLRGLSQSDRERVRAVRGRKLKRVKVNVNSKDYFNVFERI